MTFFDFLKRELVKAVSILVIMISIFVSRANRLEQKEQQSKTPLVTAPAVPEVAHR